MSARRVWPVFVAYLLAFVGIVAFTLAAALVLHGLYPELPEREVFDGLPGLLAGALASSSALMVTLLAVMRPLDPARLRLKPGRETGPTLVVMIVGTLALGQTLDSATAVAGLADRGTMAVIRRALEGTSGLDLFAAALVIGVIAGVAEEVFFRGYMQTRLAEQWPPSVAVLVTSFAFGLLHLEWLHAMLAFGLGLWLGFVTERAGSALPAVAAHVINNTLFTVLTAGGITVTAFWPNAVLGGASALVFAGCAVWLGRAPGLRPLGPEG
ncbi:MAG: hypothetical protein AUG00_00120 [Candidatus Rokubacteria bacterium 13_1_20CM_2_70_7]|nr:MAG: hypothetical protein AUG00_00120 [Candidatus Rokubacteria bacterium 13_1_20CM_2_70_7]